MLRDFMKLVHLIQKKCIGDTLRCGSLKDPRQHMFAYRAFQIDDAFAFELADQGDNLLLGRLHIANLDGAQAFHIFLQHFRAALGHAFQEVIPQLIAGALQRHSQHLAVHPREDLLDAGLVDQQQVFENEHQVADGLDERRVSFLDDFEDFLAGDGIETIEHFGNGAHAAIRLAAELPECGKFLADDIGNFGNDFGDIWSRLAIRRATSARMPGGSDASSAAAWEGFRWESTRAMVWGCSL